MAVQFFCSKCNNAIEVDDHLAGQMATCPYCQTAIRVPVETDLYAPPAKPASVMPPTFPTQPNQPLMYDRHTQPTYIRVNMIDPAKQKKAVQLAKIALIASVLIFVVLAINTGIQMVLLHKTLPNGFQFSQDMTQQKVFQDQIMEAGEVISKEHPVLRIVEIVLFPLGWVALVLAIVSLSIARTWQGWVALGFCVPSVLCFCCSGIGYLGM